MKQVIMVVALALVCVSAAMIKEVRAENSLLFYGADLSRDTFPDTLKKISRVVALSAIPDTSALTPPTLPAVPKLWPGQLDMSFTLFAESHGGLALWSEEWSNVPVDGEGVFHVLLGSNEPLDLALFEPNGSYYIQIAVKGVDYGGRRKIRIPGEEPWMTPLSGNAPPQLAQTLVETLNALAKGDISAQKAATIDGLVKTLMTKDLKGSLRVPVKTPPGR